MQRGNLILFMVLCLVVLLGWIPIQNMIWPPKPKDVQKKEVKKDDEKEKAKFKEEWAKAWKSLHPVAQTFLIGNQFFDSSPLLDLVWLTVDPKLLPNYTKPPGPEELRLARIASLLVPPDNPFGPLPSLGHLTTFSLPYVETQPDAIVKTIGGPDYFLEAKLTSRGAGVQSLWLNKFQAADYLGRPVPNQRLELIQDDPFMPSFLMFHYEEAKGQRDKMRPVNTLGVVNWHFVDKRPLEGGGEEVIFSTPLISENYKDFFINKIYRLRPKDYHLTLILEIENRGKAAGAPLRYQLMGSHGMPIEGQWYTATFRDALIGLVNDTGSVDRNRQDSRTIGYKRGGSDYPEQMPGGYFMRYAGVATQYFASVIVVDDTQPKGRDGGKSPKSLLEWARPTLESMEIAARLKEVSDDELLAASTKEKGAFVYRLLPRVKKHLANLKLEPEANVVISYYENERGQRIATWIRKGTNPLPQFDDITVRVNSSELLIEPDTKIAHQFMLYHGPVKTRLLGQFGGDKAVPSETVATYTDTLSLYTLTDYRSDGFFGRVSQAIMFTNLLIFVTNLMHTLLYWFSFLVGNYGLAIILLTVVVRGLMFPISKKQALFSMRMQQLAPELKKIQEKYKGDAKAKTEATMEFYRKHKINPLGSCLPLLMQLPIFLGLYFALQESIHFRLAGFLWIDNLAAPDMFLFWSESIPWISDPDNIGGMFYLGPFLNVLPLVAVALMLVQQRMMAPPVVDEQQAMQMKIMKFMMIFIAILFYKVAAGLAVYFIASSLWGLAERRLLPKKEALALAGPVPPTGKGPPPGKGGPGKGGPAKTKAPAEEPTGPFARLKKWWADVLKEAKKK